MFSIRYNIEHFTGNCNFSFLLHILSVVFRIEFQGGIKPFKYNISTVTCATEMNYGFFVNKYFSY